MKAFLILFIVFFIFTTASYNQEEIICGTESIEPIQIEETIGTENLAVVLIDFPDGRINGNIPTQDSQLDQVANINAVGAMGWIKNPNNPNQLIKKVRKYTYDDYWDKIFSDYPIYTGTRSPDSASHNIKCFGSVKDYYKEVSYNNLTIVAAQTWSGGSDKYHTGIINTYDEVNVGGVIKKFVRWIMMDNPKSAYTELLDEVITKLQEQKSSGAIWFEIDPFLNNGGKILIIFAGSDEPITMKARMPFQGGNLLSVREKNHDNSNNQSILDGICSIVHEYGHTLGFNHLSAGKYDPMNLTLTSDWDILFSPPHFNPIYKFQKG
jgi:M6 family metalloprotease-like protein